MKVVAIAQRAPRFADRRATSIDLCIRDLVAFSRYRATTTIIGDYPSSAFTGLAFEQRPIGSVDAFYVRRHSLRRMIERLDPDVVCVHEQLRMAAYLADVLPVPVILQKHNPVKAPRNALDGFLNTRTYNKLDGIILVSEALQRDLESRWPRVRVPRKVVPNAIDTSVWTAAATRRAEILVVGRATPAKGILEAAQAMAAVLPQHPAWRASFILNEIEAQPDYFAQVREALAGLGAQASLLVQQPYDVVKSAMENAAIALVPSIWNEPFGRVALEAHAGRAAVISSGTGGLREVSANTALYLPEVSPAAIESAVQQLIMDEALRADLADRGHARAVATFDIRAGAAACDDFYDSLTAGAR